MKIEEGRTMTTTDLERIREEAEREAGTVISRLKSMREELLQREKDVTLALDEIRTSSTILDIDKAAFDEAVKVLVRRPYAIIPRKEGEWYLLVLKGIPLNVGWFSHEEGAFNVFVVNRIISLIQPVPEQLKEELDLSRPFDGLTVDGEHLVIESPEQDPVGKVLKRYKSHLTKAEGIDRIRIKKGHQFPLIAQIIRDGILPFSPKPVDKADLQDRKVGYELRPYQKRDYQEWLRFGSVGVFYPPGAGKACFALYIASQLKGRKLIVVPSISLKEQYEEYIAKYTPLVKEEYEIIIYHSVNVKKILREDESWALLVFDEMHRLPADHYIGLTTLKSKYRLNMTATPDGREDGRIDLVWAMSGKPLGVNWDYFIKEGYIVIPDIHVWILSSYKDKLSKLEELMEEDLATIVFCDRIELGKQLSNSLGLEFIHGQTRDRLKMARSQRSFIISRVGDEGISIKGLERVIQVDFLFGSRRQEAQRMGRLLHDDIRGEHIILMTVDEYLKYRKRLYAHYEKGFKVTLHRGEGVPDDLSIIAAMPKSARARRMKTTTPKTRRTVKPVATPISTGVSTPPRFDSRMTVTRKSILQLLGTEYAKSRGGLTAKEIIGIIRDSGITTRSITDRQVQNLISNMYRDFKISSSSKVKGRRRFFVGELAG